MADTLKKLKYFTTIVDKGSFSLAAKIVGISSPSLSLQMKKYSEEIGFQIFEKLGRGVQLTPAGRSYYLSAKSLLEMHQDALENAKQKLTDDDDTIRLGFTESALNDVNLVKLLWKINNSHTGIKVTLKEISSQKIVGCLHDDRIDLAFSYEDASIRDEEVEQILVSSSRVFIAVPSTHALAKEITIDIDIIRDLELIVSEDPNDSEGIVGTLQSIAHETGDRLKIVCKVSSSLQAINLVSAGFGVTLISENEINTSIDGINYIPIKPNQLKQHLWAQWIKDDSKEKLKEIIEIIRI